MNSHLRLIAALTLACSPILHAEDKLPTPAGKQEVIKLDGTKFLGIVEVTDDYTVRIQSDSGIQNIPIALLGDRDFRKFGLNKDRTQDGRLWSERKTALEEEKKTPSKNSTAAAIEIRLAEVAPFQPVIELYESAKPKSTVSQNKSASEDTEKGTNSTGESSTLHMFTGPGSLNLPSVPFASGAAQTVISPATSITPAIPGMVATPALTPP